REIGFDQRLEQRQHAMRLPLLVAEESDRLARERVDARGVRLTDRGRAGWIVEFDAHGLNLRKPWPLSRGGPIIILTHKSKSSIQPRAGCSFGDRGGM